MNDITNKYRQARKGNTELVVVEGAHAFKHAVRFGADIVHVALAPNAEAESLLAEYGGKKELEVLHNKAQSLSEEEWGSLTPNPPSTGLVALARKPALPTSFIGETVVFIENPNSLFNVGAIIRTLAAAGVDSFAMTGRHNPWHADCISTSRGLHWALQHISLMENVEQLTEMAKMGEYKIFAMDTDTDTFLNDIKDDTGKKLFMFGTEREGLSKQALALANSVVKIPMRSGVSSLNLASSVAVTVYA